MKDEQVTGVAAIYRLQRPRDAVDLVILPARHRTQAEVVVRDDHMTGKPGEYLVEGGAPRLSRGPAVVLAHSVLSARVDQ